jgi:hypothetical protein
MSINKEKLREAIHVTEYYRDQLGEPQGNIAGKQKYFCPFHPDKKTPNLIADEKGVKCFACDEGGDIFWFHGKLKGIPFAEVLKDLAGKYAPNLLSSNGNGKHSKRIVAAYDYQDETGKLLFQVVRHEPKDFKQRTPNENGGWSWGLNGVRRVPYRLPELLASDGPVYIPGGEKDCETLIRLGITATTNPCGEGNWKPEFNEYLKGRKVVVFEDNDQQGRKHGRVIAESLYGIAEAVKVISFPELPEHGDVSDYLQSHTKDDLFQRIKDASFYEPAKEENKIIPFPVPANGTGLNELMESAGISALSENSGPDEILATITKFEAITNNQPPLWRDVAQSSILKKLKDIKFPRASEILKKAFGNGTGKEESTQQGQTLLFEDLEPWPDEVDGAELLDEIKTTIERHIILPKWAAEAISLWILHAWTLSAFYLSPILRITSPTKGCGKSLLLILIQVFLPRGYSTANVTTAAMYRLVDQYQISLCVDEADQSFRNNEDLVSLVNAGYLRKTASVPRCEGDKNEVRVYSAWCPKVIAGIGNLSETTESRCIEIRLEKKTRDEKVEKLAFRDLDLLAQPICQKAVRWSEDHLEELSISSPHIPKDLEDRPGDNWTPLIAVADIVGGEWPQKARKAALHLSASNEEDEIPSVQLLKDMKDLFQKREIDRISSSELAEHLGGMEDRPWPEFKKGQKITARQIARLLKRFGIKPKTIRTSEGTPKGYSADDLKDVFSRYARPQSATNATPLGNKDLGDFKSATNQPDVADRKQSNLFKNKDCCGVADGNGGMEEKKINEVPSYENGWEKRHFDDEHGNPQAVWKKDGVEVPVCGK